MFVNCCIMARIHSIVVSDESKLAVLIILVTLGPFRRVGPDILHSAALKPSSFYQPVLPSPLQRLQEARLAVKYKQCIIIERRFTADRSSKAVDGNFVERDAKRRASLLPSQGFAPRSNLLMLPFSSHVQARFIFC